jgi:hypothetical protein
MSTKGERGAGQDELARFDFWILQAGGRDERTSHVSLAVLAVRAVMEKT